MKDISDNLLRATTADKAWFPHRFSMAISLFEEDNLILDWDQDAGEEWARIVNSNDVMAFIHSRRPLLFVHASKQKLFARLSPDSRDVEVLIYEDIDINEFLASRESLMQFVDGDIERINRGGFSVGDLIWLTI